MFFNQSERYLIKQRFSGSGDSTSLVKQKEAQDNRIGISDVGLHPSDITLSFLYWNFSKEYPREKVRGQECRVIHLQDPDSTDFATIWISKKYCFPLRVMWSHSSDQLPFRTLDFTGFEKIKEAWIIKELRVTGEGWKTVVKLKDNTVELITPDEPVPGDLFLSD